LKTPESIIKKLFRKGGAGSLAEINDTIKDIAGIRIACSFVSDIYRICGMLERQSDLRVVSKKDYIESPKPNGYRSLHLIVEVPVFMSDRQELVCVEVQIRTIAMDFWASLEHKIFYKYDEDVPSRLLAELKEAAETSFALDRKMERLHLEVEELKSNRNGLDADEVQLFVGDRHFHIPDRLLRLMQANAGNEGSKIN
jgi:putative GTP pyrophosphokinase